MGLLKLTEEEKKAFIHIIISAFFYGFFLSFILIKEIIARKALNASDFQLSLLVMIFPVTSVFSIWWGRILEKAKNKSKYFLLIAVFGRLALIVGMFIANMNHFLILAFIVFTFHSSYIPARNSIYQSKIGKISRGKIFGIAVSITTLISIIFVYFSGRMLDINESFFQYLLLIIGILGFLDCLFLYFVKLEKKQKKEPVNLRTIIMEPLLRSVEILKRNREFARFEISFMIYGMGFIMMMMAVPIFLVDVMKFNYTTSFFAKAILAQIGIFLLSPFMGSLHDKKHPSNFAVISFGLLSLYPGILLISQLIEPYKIQMLVVFAGFFIFGIARAADMVVWNMGSVYFAQNEDSSMYQSIHVTLMGIRGVAAPLLGVVIKKLMDTNGIFIFSAFFFIIASIYSYFSYKKTNFYLKGKN